ncbi:antitoxin [Cellulomonas dongxiuzhuiae]|uniref:Antitoxin n=1 Tax=Cellulomonas dongxiuzhuiae TaxID=2819979 RepID=A0ABX8GJH2_9CELL|nr:antitoxin [Cellulomonas dongxiuzhuiae]QWC15811.1 antitoxin [Cellulomonas dongxiuzhuiae]
MGLDDMVKKAKGALSGREEQAKGALDKAAEAVKARTGTGTDATIDKVVDAAKDQLDRQKKS